MVSRGHRILGAQLALGDSGHHVDDEVLAERLQYCRIGGAGYPMDTAHSFTVLSTCPLAGNPNGSSCSQPASFGTVLGSAGEVIRL